MSGSSERSEAITEPRYVKRLVYVICVPFERMMGDRSVGLFCSDRFGTKRTSVFDFLSMLPVCIWSPNRFR